MLNLIKIDNLPFENLKQAHFDLGIFASGYESRSSSLARKLDPDFFSHKIVFGFQENTEEEIRIQNDKYYRDHYTEISPVSSQEEKEIYSKLIEKFELIGNQKEISVLIDYTSMSRIWYAGILNFIRFQIDKVVKVCVNYSLGEYGESYLDYTYTSINSIPYHEGSLSSNTKTLLVLAIGFSPYLIKSVIEEIEPNHIIGIMPVPNLKVLYAKISENIQQDILTNDIDEWVKCPVYDLEAIFRTYAELASNNCSSKDIIFLSLGPKIFTMASILVAQRFPQVTCLYLKSPKKKGIDVKATGDFICNVITYST